MVDEVEKKNYTRENLRLGQVYSSLRYNAVIV
jgi:hypothetical protein